MSVKSFSERYSVKKLCLMALFMGMTIALSSFSIPVPGGHLYLNDIAICMASLIFPPISACIVGGVGAFLGDVFFYPTPMFVSLITHGLQAFIISLIARSGKRLSFLPALIGVTAGAVIMVSGYSIGRAFFYATPEAALLKLPFQILQAGVGAATAIVVSFFTPVKKLMAQNYE